MLLLSDWFGIIASPFGERFHFRTSLSVQECQRRIDALRATSFLDTNFSGDPVTVRRGNRFWMYENQAGAPPELKGKIRFVRGWTDVIGRGGSNLLPFSAGILAFLTVAGVGLYSAVFDHGAASWVLVALSAPAGLVVYGRSYKNPHAERIIDYLGQMLDAEPLSYFSPQDRGRP